MRVLVALCQGLGLYIEELDSKYFRLYRPCDPMADTQVCYCSMKEAIESNKESEVAQLCVTLCNPMDGSLPGSSVRGIFQARVKEWVAISFSRASSRSGDRTQVSHIAGRCFTL